MQRITLLPVPDCQNALNGIQYRPTMTILCLGFLASPTDLISERDLISALAHKGPSAASIPIQEVVTGPVLSVSPDESLKRAMALMTCNRLRHLPVFEDRELIGIVSLGDLVKYRLEEMELESNVLRDLAIAAR